MASIRNLSARTALFCALGASLAFAGPASALSADTDPGETWGLLLAQAAAAETGDPAVELGAQPAAGAAAEAEATTVSPRRRERRSTEIDYAARRDRFERMQNTGFNLMMGGIAAGVGGIALMIYGASQFDTNHNSDPYGNSSNDGDAGIFPFAVGYISLLVGFPTLLTTGIILNRIGNHKRIQSEELMGSFGPTRLDVGLNSVRLSYSF